MCQLSMDELTEQERAKVDRMREMLNPYVQIASIDWITEPCHAPDVFDLPH